MMLCLLIPLWVASAREAPTRPQASSLSAEVARLELMKAREEHHRLLGRFERLKQNEAAAIQHESEANQLKEARIKAANEAYRQLKPVPATPQEAPPISHDVWFKRYVGEMTDAKRAHSAGLLAKAKAEDHELQARFHVLKNEKAKAAEHKDLAARSHQQADQHFRNARLSVQRFALMRDQAPPVLKPSPLPVVKETPLPEPKSFMKRIKRMFESKKSG